MQPPSSPSNKNPQSVSSYQTRIGTYNILMKQSNKPKPYSTKMGYDYIDGVPLENSIRRYEIIKNNILNANLDILCLQEVVINTFNRLKNDLAQHGYVGEWEKHENYHGVGIFYNVTRYTQVFKEVHFFETQKTFESDQTNIKKKRVHLSLDLFDRITLVYYRVVSVHLLDPRSLVQEDEHSSFVIKQTHIYPKDYKIKRTIIAGDMNLDQWGNQNPLSDQVPNLKKIKGFQPFTITNYKTDDSFRNTEYEKDQSNDIVCKNRRIDWIFVRSGTKPKPSDLDSFDPSGSDHHLVISAFSEKKNKLISPDGLQVQDQSLLVL
jgi:mRNA deadenylase 3'-5' endonuclease subunit Ccr4